MRQEVLEVVSLLYAELASSILLMKSCDAVSHLLNIFLLQVQRKIDHVTQPDDRSKSDIFAQSMVCKKFH